MFSFFKKKKVAKTNDKVWLKLAGKQNGFLDDIKAELAAKQTVFVPYFFDSSKEWVEQILEKHNIGFDTLERASRTTDVVLIDANDVESSARLSTDLKKLSEGENCQFLFPDHYPLHFIEANFLKHLSSMHEEDRTFEFYMSLEDPLMKMFGADRIGDMMTKMGHKENECIKHNMISKSISRAQQKIEQQVSHAEKASSPKDWFLRNVPAN